MNSENPMITALHALTVTEGMKIVYFKGDDENPRKELMVDIPTAFYQEGATKYEICSGEVMRFAVDEIMKGVSQMFDDNNQKYDQTIQLKELELKSIVEVIDETMKRYKSLIADFNKYKSETEALRKENAEYKEWYGKYINPTQILEELYNGGKVGQYDILVKKEHWKSKMLKRNTSGVRFWLSFMEEHKIFNMGTKNNRVALVSRDRAKQILKEKR